MLASPSSHPKRQQICLSLRYMLLLAGLVAPYGTSHAAPLFQQGFETTVTAPLNPLSGGSAGIVPGPAEDEVLTARPDVGFSGTHALRVDVTGPEFRGVLTETPSSLPVILQKNSILHYMIFPVAAPRSLENAATYIALTLVFADGSTSARLGLKDLSGALLTPEGQGAGRALYPNQWNEVSAPLGAAAGKTVRRIEVRAINPKHHFFHAYLDDIVLNSAPARAPTPADLVDTRRGTNANGRYSRGNTFPAIAVPHGFNFWTPVTRGGSNWLYQYQENNSPDNHLALEAISLSHEPSPWMGDRQTFQIMPVLSGAPPAANRTARASRFSHAHEMARPYRYRVTLDSGISADIAPTSHATLMRFVFPGDHGQLAFDNINDRGSLTLSRDGKSADGYTDVASSLSTGATRMFIHIAFDNPVVRSGHMTGQQRDTVQRWAAFETHAGRPVIVRIATSLISAEQARHNLNAEIPAGTTLETVADAAKASWNDRLSRVVIPNAPADEQRTLYGNLYRLFLYPNTAAETVNGRLVHASPFAARSGLTTSDHTGASVIDGSLYVNNGFWDTYRTAWPAYALLAPREAGRMIDGFVQQYREGGWIARWSSPGYADLMTGTSADVAFADAWRKGVHNVDIRQFYDAALKDATVAPDLPGVGRKGLARSAYKGFTDTDTDQGFSWSSAGYLNDFAIGELAEDLASDARPGSARRTNLLAEAWYLHNRALDYVTLFNPHVGFFMGRHPDGSWRTTAQAFDPFAWGGDYTETNAWTMAFDPVHDLNGLASLYGGRRGLAAKLDAYFAAPAIYHEGAYGGVIHEMREMHDVRMGQYSHSNQPAHHLLYLYDAVGQPWKTQDKIRDAMNRLYRGSDIGQGYPGDEDNGEMSAWWIFSAAGLYPLRVGTPTYAIGAPRFPLMTLRLGETHHLTIRAPAVSDRNRYIQSAELNGKPLTRWWVTQDELIDGQLTFIMGSKPSSWASGAALTPPSLSKAGERPNPASDLMDSDRAMIDGPTAAHDNDSMTVAAIGKAGLTLRLPSAHAALAYTLTSGENPALAPASWDILASDDGIHWQVADHRTNERFRWKYQLRPFLLPHPAAHRFYRWVPQSPAIAHVGEIEFLGHVPPDRP